MNLRGKTVVITGASSGIGRAAAIEMARRGANLVLGARRVELLATVADECRTHGVEASVVTTDVNNPEDCRRLITAAGEVDVLVNNAGFAILDQAVDAELYDLRQMMETNYFGVVHCTRAVLPGMVARRRGTIINVASITGLMGYAGMSGYCATKFAVIGFTEAVRDEVIGDGVRVALICPGTTETDFFIKAERRKMPAASRLLPSVTAEDVARAVCNAAEDGRYRRILPSLAAIYMRFKEFFPRTAHLIMRSVSRALQRK